LVVEALMPLDGRRTSITWPGQDFAIRGDNHVPHGGDASGPDGFDLLAAALGQCLLNTLLARAQAEGIVLRSAQALVATKARLRGKDVAPYLGAFEVDIYLDGDLDETVRLDLERSAKQRCGVRETLLRTPEIVERVHLGPPS
jgi:uncharacterized OsmC-like protein